MKDTGNLWEPFPISSTFTSFLLCRKLSDDNPKTGLDGAVSEQREVKKKEEEEVVVEGGGS